MGDSRVVIGLNVRLNISNKTKDWLGSIKVFDLETFSIYDVPISELDDELLKFKEMCDNYTIGEVSSDSYDKLKGTIYDYGRIPIYSRNDLLNSRRESYLDDDKQYANLVSIYVNDVIKSKDKNASNMVTCGIIIDAENFDFCIKFGCYVAYSSNPNREWNLGISELSNTQVKSYAELMCGYNIRCDSRVRGYISKLAIIDTNEKIVYGDLMVYRASEYHSNHLDIVVDNDIKSTILELRSAFASSIVFPPSIKNVYLNIGRGNYNSLSNNYNVYFKAGSEVNMHIIKNGNYNTIDGVFNSSNFDELEDYIKVNIYE